MAYKRRSVTLTQDSDDSFRIKAFANTTELSVGMVVSRAKLNKWCGMQGVEVKVIGLTPPTSEDSQLDLFTKSEVKALKAAIASP